MSEIRIKFERTLPGDHDSYGEEFIRQLNVLEAQFGGIDAYVGQHEDGPEIMNLVVAQLPNYITAIVALIGLWKASTAWRKSFPSLETVQGTQAGRLLTA